MPGAIKRLCRKCGCGNTTTETYCVEHQRVRDNGIRLRATRQERGYDSRWQKFRQWFLAKHPLCVDCLRGGRCVEATEVDHIVALRRGGDKYALENLQPLCKPCHSRKTAQEMQFGGGRV
jgi:5-methylcytosine-specific restriction protein A